MNPDTDTPAPPPWPEDLREQLAGCARQVLREHGGIPLDELLGRDWAGLWSNGAYLFLPGWRVGFTPAELRALWAQLMEQRVWRYEMEQLRAELARREAETEELARRCAFYRRQVQLEARLGMMLAGLAG